MVRQSTGASAPDDTDWSTATASRSRSGRASGSDRSAAPSGAASSATLDPAVAKEMETLARGGVISRADFNERVVDALRCLPQEAALRALAHLAQAVSSIQISTVRNVPAYIMSIIAKHQPGREGRLRDNPVPAPAPAPAPPPPPPPKAPSSHGGSSSVANGGALDPAVERQLESVFSAGLLQKDDFNDRIMAALRGMSPERAVRALQYLSRAVSAEQLSGVRVVPAYVMSMITDPRHAREPGPREREGGAGGGQGHREGRGARGGSSGGGRRSDRSQSAAASAPSPTKPAQPAVPAKAAEPAKPPVPTGPPPPQPPRLSSNPPSGQTWAARLRGVPSQLATAQLPPQQAQEPQQAPPLQPQQGAGAASPPRPADPAPGGASPRASQQPQARQRTQGAASVAAPNPATDPVLENFNGPRSSAAGAVPSEAARLQQAAAGAAPSQPAASGPPVLTQELVDAVVAHLAATGGRFDPASAGAAATAGYAAATAGATAQSSGPATSWAVSGPLAHNALPAQQQVDSAAAQQAPNGTLQPQQQLGSSRSLGGSSTELSNGSMQALVQLQQQQQQQQAAAVAAAASQQEQQQAQAQHQQQQAVRQLQMSQSYGSIAPQAASEQQTNVSSAFSQGLQTSGSMPASLGGYSSQAQYGAAVQRQPSGGAGFAASYPIAQQQQPGGSQPQTPKSPPTGDPQGRYRAASSDWQEQQQAAAQQNGIGGGYQAGQAHQQGQQQALNNPGVNSTLLQQQAQQQAQQQQAVQQAQLAALYGSMAGQQDGEALRAYQAAAMQLGKQGVDINSVLNGRGGAAAQQVAQQLQGQQQATAQGRLSQGGQVGGQHGSWQGQQQAAALNPGSREFQPIQQHSSARGMAGSPAGFQQQQQQQAPYSQQWAGAGSNTAANYQQFGGVGGASATSSTSASNAPNGWGGPAPQPQQHWGGSTTATPGQGFHQQQQPAAVPRQNGGFGGAPGPALSAAPWAPGGGRRSGPSPSAGSYPGQGPAVGGYGGPSGGQQVRGNGQHFRPGGTSSGNGARGRSAEALNLSAQQLQHLSNNGALSTGRQQYGQQAAQRGPMQSGYQGGAEAAKALQQQKEAQEEDALLSEVTRLKTW